MVELIQAILLFISTFCAVVIYAYLDNQKMKRNSDNCGYLIDSAISDRKQN